MERCRSLRTKEHRTNCQIWLWQYNDWECFAAKGIGRISVIDDKMNAQKYKQILKENLMFSVESLWLPSDYILKRYNDHKHTGKSTKK